MISSERSGSRLPVGSSASTSCGSLTSARAIAMRCCSPPDSSSGSAFMRCCRPTHLSTWKVLRCCTASGDAEHAHHEGDVLEHGEARDRAGNPGRRSRRSPVALDLRGAERPQVAARDLQIAFARQLLAEQQAQQRRLPRAARPGEEQELALVDGQREIAQRIDAAAVELGKMMSFYQATGQKRCLCTTVSVVLEAFSIRTST